MVEALSDKYLGLPLLVGVDRSDCFQYLVDRLFQQSHGGLIKTLSMGGNEVKLKAVAQATPTYAMSVFFIPKKITDAISQCWWGDDVEKKDALVCVVETL
jgi:hypothetical protein